MIGGPDAASYEALLEKLLDIKRGASVSSVGDLEASFEALAAVVGFLNSDVRIVETEAARPLFRLMLALYDRMQGAKPKLFFDRPVLKGHSGAPSHTSAPVILRMLVNFAFLSLREAGISKQQAGKWLAAELKRSAIGLPNGRALNAATIIRWAAEIGGKSPKGSDWAIATFIHIHGATSASHGAAQDHQDSTAPPNPQRAKLAALGFIKFMRILGF